jgi:hypothetical protein
MDLTEAGHKRLKTQNGINPKGYEYLASNTILLNTKKL